VLGLLLLLCGCAATAVGQEQGGPTAGVSTPPADLSPRPSVTPEPARPAEPEPTVPQRRATLGPEAVERPAPARFSADSINVELPVVATGVATDVRMQLPETNEEVAWYAFGARPGDPVGTTVMAAHVDTRAEGLGPFSRLRRLDRGDDIQVTDAAGRAHRYRVTTVDDVKKSKISLDQLFRRDGSPQLKVLTCGGPYSRETGYRDNIVVTATPW